MTVRLAIGLPISDEKVHTQFFLSFMALERPQECHLIYPTGGFHFSDIGKVRTNLCDQAIELGCTHLLMMDTDQVYHDQDLITRLLDHKKPVVCGKVHRRYPPFEPILNVNREHVDDSVIDAGGLVKVDATGTGCMLIDLEVLKSIPYPWFELSTGDDGKPVGEDIGFCYKAGKAGFNVYVDCDVNIGHLATVQVNDAIYRLFKKINKVNK